ncbi:hypothetical protein [Sphingomonas sp.]|uniref:hypothetical protein n=1 Tax=Sphingomonas sp. TaxID=28214 RepID=UPI0025EE5F2E|nr:hypothetical protein [Sphingomonas sp.]
MSDRLSIERFQELANAYGGVVARWPGPHREAGTTMASDPPAKEILAQALSLDDVLDTWHAPVVTDSMRKRVMADTPVPRSGFARRARLWWSGIGIAAALTGAVAGAATVAIVAPIDASSDGGTSFGDVGPQGT